MEIDVPVAAGDRKSTADEERFAREEGSKQFDRYMEKHPEHAALVQELRRGGLLAFPSDEQMEKDIAEMVRRYNESGIPSADQPEYQRKLVERADVRKKLEIVENEARELRKRLAEADREVRLMETKGRLAA